MRFEKMIDIIFWSFRVPPTQSSDAVLGSSNFMSSISSKTFSLRLRHIMQRVDLLLAIISHRNSPGNASNHVLRDWNTKTRSVKELCERSGIILNRDLSKSISSKSRSLKKDQEIVWFLDTSGEQPSLQMESIRTIDSQSARHLHLAIADPNDQSVTTGKIAYQGGVIDSLFTCTLVRSLAWWPCYT